MLDLGDQGDHLRSGAGFGPPPPEPDRRQAVSKESYRCLASSLATGLRDSSHDKLNVVQVQLAMSVGAMDCKATEEMVISRPVHVGKSETLG